MVAEPVAALMSIRQPYTDLILDGTKKVELRRVPMKRDITHVIIYESGGTGRVVGYFEVSHVIEDAPATIWRRFRGVTGLKKSQFDDYYSGRDVAVAIGVKRAVRLKTPRSLADFQIDRPPQSFMYLCASYLRDLS